MNSLAHRNLSQTLCTTGTRFNVPLAVNPSLGLTLKRLCVYYRLAHLWRNKNVEWIVCKDCQRDIRRGLQMFPITVCNRYATKQAPIIGNEKYCLTEM